METTKTQTPKIFISYSWSSDELVLSLAQRLVSQGVDVVLDKWDLKEGQDKYQFMERCVNDPEITKVLIVCDKVYAEKANNRTGGVGDETVIISSEIYGNLSQEKFIPIIAEKEENGKPYVPAYIKTRIYIDLSDDEKYEAEYEKLLRNIYGKPLYVKPALGKRPEWLDEEKTNYFLLSDLIKQIRGSATENRRKSCISRFKTEYKNVLKTFYVKDVTEEAVFNNFLETQRVRDYYLDFLEVIAENDPEFSDVITDFFEDVYNAMTNIKIIENSNVMQGSDDDIDVFKIHLWELFIFTFVYLRHIGNYKAMNAVLTHTYFLETSIFGGNLRTENYTAFRHHSELIEERYKPMSEYKNQYTLLGDVICHQRERLPIYTCESIAEADLFLYQVCNGLDLYAGDDFFGIYWFPNLYIYAQNKGLEWKKLCSRGYCKKMFDLFGVDNVADLKERIAKCVYDRRVGYRENFHAAPAITNFIKVEEIGSLN